MNCSEINLLILDYFEKNISTENTKILSEHLKTCSKCSQDIANLESLNSLLKNYNEELIQKREFYFENLNSRIWNRISSSSTKKAYKYSYAFSTLSVVLAIITFVFLFRNSGEYSNLLTDNKLNAEELYTEQIKDYYDIPFEEITDEKIQASEYFNSEYETLNNINEKIVPSMDYYSFPLYNVPELDEKNIEQVINELNNKDFI